MNRRRAACLALCAGVLLPACGTEVPRADREGPIVAFGDSLVYGTGSSGGGFVAVLEQRLGRDIENLGRPGETTAAGLARLEEVVALEPSVVILLLGGNDVLRRVAPQETFQNLATMIERLQAEGATVLLVGVRGGLLQDPFASQFAALAERYGTAHVPDVLQEVFLDADYMADQVHPNDAGYVRIADRIQPVLEDMLR
jgi:acyl-CoA thioesterase-1